MSAPMVRKQVGIHAETFAFRASMLGRQVARCSLDRACGAPRPCIDCLDDILTQHDVEILMPGGRVPRKRATGASIIISRSMPSVSHGAVMAVPPGRQDEHRLAVIGIGVSPNRCIDVTESHWRRKMAHAKP